jgi:hypothetical protein
MSYFSWRPYVPVAQRQKNAQKELAKLAKRGESPTPVKVEGRKIADSFWGRSWCENLERYSDFANRLPRGRTYVRNGSAIDLRIGPREVTAKVSGAEIYSVRPRAAGCGAISNRMAAREASKSCRNASPPGRRSSRRFAARFRTDATT